MDSEDPSSPYMFCVDNEKVWRDVDLDAWYQVGVAK